MSGVYTIPQLRDILSPIFGKYDIRKAVLFGSYGKGTASSKSDVDLLVDSGLRGLLISLGTFKVWSAKM